MNKNICGAGNEHSVGCTEMTQRSSADYQLWNSMTIKRGMVVRNPFKQQNGKNLYKKKTLQQGNILQVNCICGNS
jgi:hypothetical protein